MQFPRPKKKQQILDPILPLINVVFLLLIFVMMMSSVDGSDGYDVAPPVSTSEDPAGQREALLLLTKDGEVRLEGVAMDDAALMQYALEQKRDHPDQIVKIRADAKVDSMQLIALMESLRIGGVENLVLLTEKRN